MPPLELAAIVLITLALVLYSLGVWAERIRLVPCSGGMVLGMTR